MIVYIEPSCTEPEKNLEFEKSLCNSYFLLPAFMLWRNEPSVIVGRFGNVEDEVNIDFANNNNIKEISSGDLKQYELKRWSKWGTE